MDVVKACNAKFDRWLESNTGQYSKGYTGYGSYDREVLDMPSTLDNPIDEVVDYASILRNNK